jgi:hypothetical protein
MNSVARIGVVSLVALQVMAAEIRISANTAKGRADCSSPNHLELTGSVFEVQEGSFALDLCLPTQDCNTRIRADFHVVAPGFVGFTRYLKPSAFVRVTTETEVRGGHCAQRIAVSGLAFWVGDRNPAGRPDEFYFAAGVNMTDPPKGAPFQVERCPKARGTLGLRTGEQGTTLSVGLPREWEVGDRAPWTARLLGAGACSATHGWSYWVAGAPVP